MRIFYSKYVGLTIGWKDCNKSDDNEHLYDCRNHIAISFTGNNMWELFKWRCFTSWSLFTSFIDDIFWLPYAYSTWKNNQIARETYYIWGLFKIYVEIECLEHVKSKWIKS